MTDKKALIAMSGGVDSAVCAYLLRQAGIESEGVTMRLWSAGETLPDAETVVPVRSLSVRASVGTWLSRLSPPTPAATRRIRAWTATVV